MILLITYVTVAISVSFICSILEAVLLSITPSYIAQLRLQGNPAAERITKLKEDIDRPLASILTLNTIAHTVGAAASGAQAAKIFGDAWLGLFSAFLTLAILLLSEIMPKTLGATYWRQLAPRAATIMLAMVWALTPIVWAFEQLTRRLARGKQEPKFRDELSAMALLAKESGELGDDESTMLNNLLSLREVCVTKLMTPRPVLFRVDINMTIEEFLTEHHDTPFSRPLLYSGSRDNILGFVHRLELFYARQHGKGAEPLGSLMRALPVVHDSTVVPKAFDRLMAQRSQLALIVDEYGDVQGIITIEDIFEHLTGKEIIDEADKTSNMQDLAHERWANWKEAHGVIQREDDDDDEEEDDDKKTNFQKSNTAQKRADLKREAEKVEIARKEKAQKDEDISKEKSDAIGETKSEDIGEVKSEDNFDEHNEKKNEFMNEEKIEKSFDLKKSDLEKSDLKKDDEK